MKQRVIWHSEPVEVPGVSAKYWDTETAFTIYCATWLRKHGYRFHHSANERVGGRSGLMARLKGQSKGMPDLVVFAPMVAIELKVGNGRVSAEQADWLQYLESIGWRVGVARSFEEFQIILNSKY